MNCKNCNTLLQTHQNYCWNCSAKIIRKRLTLKGLIQELSANVFSWDNRYFLTLVNMFYRPEKAMEAFVNGVRKKYTNPLSYLAICAAIGALIQNIFQGPYLEMIESQTLAIMESLTHAFGNSDEIYDENNPFKNPTEEAQLKGQREVNLFFIQHFYLMSFLLLPVFTLISKVVYRKPYNFAEHLVFNAYIQGTLIIANLFLIAIAILWAPAFFWFFYPLTFAFYLYAFSRFYKHKIGQILLKLLKFMGLLLLLLFIYLLIAIVIGLILTFKSQTS